MDTTENNALLAWANKYYKFASVAAIVAASVTAQVSSSVQSNQALNRAELKWEEAKMESEKMTMRIENNFDRYRLETEQRVKAVEKQVELFGASLDAHRQEHREDIQNLRLERSNRLR